MRACLLASPAHTRTHECAVMRTLAAATQPAHTRPQPTLLPCPIVPPEHPLGFLHGPPSLPCLLAWPACLPACLRPLGVPYDGGTTNRSGARHGPRGVREASTLIRRAHPVSGLVPFDLPGGRVIDLGDVISSSPFDLATSHGDITSFYAALPSGTVPLSVGGDHSISLPILRAMAARHGGPLGLVHIDAHCDTGRLLLRAVACCSKFEEGHRQGVPL